MNRPALLLSLALTLAAVSTAWADLTLVGRSSMAAIGMPTMGQERFSLQKNYLRRD